MAVVLVCLLLLVAGLVAGVGWSGRRFTPPDPEPARSAADVARRYVWFAALGIVSGALAGITLLGAGGRLAMRLLAVTAGDAAQGRLTEAEEVVGEITVDGTIGFIVFNGLFAGLTAAALYLVVRRFLPAGRLGGLVFGLGLLVVVGTTLDPLRADNPDFDIVGPGWLALVVFGALTLAFGCTLATTVARLSAWLPLPERKGGVAIRYLPAATLAALAFPVTIMLTAVGIVTVVVSRLGDVGAAVRSRPALIAGRVVTAVLVLAFLPQAVSGLVDIAGR